MKTLREYMDKMDSITESNNEFKNISDETINDIAENAFTDAIHGIQQELGVESGDLAGRFFSGNEYDQVIRILKQYIRQEILEQQPEYPNISEDISRAVHVLRQDVSNLESRIPKGTDSREVYEKILPNALKFVEANGFIDRFGFEDSTEFHTALMGLKEEAINNGNMVVRAICDAYAEALEETGKIF